MYRRTSRARLAESHGKLDITIREGREQVRQSMAERVGFEPTLGVSPKHAFQACAFSHSAISPWVVYLLNLPHGGMLAGRAHPGGHPGASASLLGELNSRGQLPILKSFTFPTRRVYSFALPVERVLRCRRSANNSPGKEGRHDKHLPPQTALLRICASASSLLPAPPGGAPPRCWPESRSRARPRRWPPWRRGSSCSLTSTGSSSLATASDPAHDLGFGTGRETLPRPASSSLPRQVRRLEVAHAESAPRLGRGAAVCARRGAESHGYKPLGRRYPETSVGWYRREFEIPASDRAGASRSSSTAPSAAC